MLTREFLLMGQFALRQLHRDSAFVLIRFLMFEL